MSGEKKETFVQHKWLWAISPRALYSVIFTAHCRACNSTFTQIMEVDANPEVGTLGKVNLPEWGCKVPDGF
jgi:hypothetical protein